MLLVLLPCRFFSSGPMRSCLHVAVLRVQIRCIVLWLKFLLFYWLTASGFTLATLPYWCRCSLVFLFLFVFVFVLVTVGYKQTQAVGPKPGLFAQMPWQVYV